MGKQKTVVRVFFKVEHHLDESSTYNLNRRFEQFKERNRPNEREYISASCEYNEPKLSSHVYYTGEKPFNFWWYYLYAALGMALPYILYLQSECVIHTVTIHKHLTVK